MNITLSTKGEIVAKALLLICFRFRGCTSDNAPAEMLTTYRSTEAQLATMERAGGALPPAGPQRSSVFSPSPFHQRITPFPSTPTERWRGARPQPEVILRTYTSRYFRLAHLTTLLHVCLLDTARRRKNELNLAGPK